jgi:hypothetical protein
MKDKVDALNQNLPAITLEINKMLKNKFNITGLEVSQIHFGPTADCPPGYEKVCKYYGNDPITKKPIIKCKCVPS